LFFRGGVVVVFVGGEDQAGFVRLVEEVGATRAVLVGVDVGKFEALAVIADGRGELLGDPVAFALEEPGVGVLEAAIGQWVERRSASVVRMGC
jgi:hypothetical protein